MRNLISPLAFSIVTFVAACGGKSAPAPGPQPTPDNHSDAKECVRSGCSGTLCVEEGQEVFTTCEWRDEYACYQQATCERQDDGECGWTQTDELLACLASPPSE